MAVSGSNTCYRLDPARSTTEMFPGLRRRRKKHKCFVLSKTTFGRCCHPTSYSPRSSVLKIFHFHLFPCRLIDLFWIIDGGNLNIWFRIVLLGI